MKRIVLSIVFTLCITNIYAQGYTPWRFGLKFSPSISWLNPEIREMKYKNVAFGYSYGLFGDKHFAENYAISSGFFITQHGGEISFDENVHELDETSLKNRLFKLQYADVPLILKLRTREIGYMTYYGQFGGSIGFNIRARADDVYFDNSIEEDIDISNDIYLFKGSLIMGAGFEYSLLGNTAVVVGIYYNNGFSNILDMGPYENKRISARANFVELTIGVVF